MFKFEELRVYQEGLVFVNNIYQLTQNFPKNETFGLISQLQRAVVSIVLNIAEGSSRSKKDFRHFLDLSRGSCYEVATILAIVKARNYINNHQYNEQYDTCVKISKMISALKNSLQ